MERLPTKALVTLGLVSTVLAFVLTPNIKAGNPGKSDVLTQVLGGTAEVAGQYAYKQAELFYHGGVSDETAQAARKADLRNKMSESGLPLSSLIRDLQKAAAPKEHRHLQGTEEKELLPWFVAAARLNPKHIEAWCIGTYWFYRQRDYPKAQAFISQGIRYNPNAYQLHMERGVLYYHLRRWKPALHDLNRAVELFPSDGDEFDLRAIRRYISYARAGMHGPGFPDR